MTTTDQAAAIPRHGDDIPDAEVDNDLGMSFQIGEPYPEYSDSDLRRAWRDGYGYGVAAAGLLAHPNDGRLPDLADAVAEAYTAEGVAIWWTEWARAYPEKRSRMETGVLVEWSGEPRVQVDTETTPDDGLRDALRALHTPEKRWQPDPDAEFSYDTREEAADETDGEPTYFEVCANCGELEMRHAVEPWAYSRDSLWPCPTIALLTEETR